METNQKIDANLLYAGTAFYVQFVDEGKEDLVFKYENASEMGATVANLLKAVNEQNINVINKDSFRFFEGPMDELVNINENLDPEAVALLEFEMFNVTRRDVVSFADFMKNAKNITKIVASGKDLAKRKFQQGFTHEIKRDATFKHPAFDNLYKSFGTKNKKEREAAEGGNYTTPGAFPAGVGGF